MSATTSSDNITCFICNKDLENDDKNSVVTVERGIEIFKKSIQRKDGRHKAWQTFYLTTVLAIFVFAMILQIPRLKVDSNVKMLVFVLWAAYGVIPTVHWTIMMGGLENPIVYLLLPRVVMMYFIIGLAFFIYITRVPERFFTGKVDYIGSSHQWWHFFVVVALYYWHNTGIKYIEYRMNHGCSHDMSW